MNCTFSQEKLNHKKLNVNIKGIADDNRPCQIWKQVLDRKDGSFIVRYKLYETCHNMEISIMYDSLHIDNSPFIFKGILLFYSLSM